MRREDKYHWMMRLAYVTASRSEDPHQQTGSVVYRHDGTIAGMGYNGLPPAVDMPDSWWADRDGRRPYMIHAEQNALRYCRPHEVVGVVSTHLPCLACMTVIGSYSISVVVYDGLLGEAHDNNVIMQVAEINGINLYQIGDRRG